jgi:xanthine dehydrogenase accessory factor
MSSNSMTDLVIALKSAGEMASGIACRLYMAGIKKIVMLDVKEPLAVRRGVSFCEALYDQSHTIEEIEALATNDWGEISRIWDQGQIPVLADPKWKTIPRLNPNVVVDAILAKRNLGTKREEATLVIGLGPGFTAGKDVHMAIETNRGHNLGRIITQGSPSPNTGIPGNIGGFTSERVLRAPDSGVFLTQHHIGEKVEKGNCIGTVNGQEVMCEIDGILRGLIRPNTTVKKGLKLGDVDPRGNLEYCYTISEKARAIGGSVLEAICRVYNRP